MEPVLDLLPGNRRRYRKTRLRSIIAVGDRVNKGPNLDALGGTKDD
jgi:hypothetical protein